MSVNKLCVRKLRVKELCMQELRVPQLCEKTGLSSDAVEQSGTFDSRKDVNGQCFSVCPARRISP